MALIRGRNWWWQYFKALFFSIFHQVKGNITLPYGYSETEITLDPLILATNIYVCIEPKGIPVCAGSVDMVGSIRKSANVFIIYADIKCNYATVHWMVDYTLADPADDM